MTRGRGRFRQAVAAAADSGGGLVPASVRARACGGWLAWLIVGLLSGPVRAADVPPLFTEATGGGGAGRRLAESPGSGASGIWMLGPQSNPATWRAGDRRTLPSGPDSDSSPATIVVDEVRSGSGDGAWDRVRVRAHPEGDPTGEILLVLHSDGETAALSWRGANGDLLRVTPNGRGRHVWTRSSHESAPRCANGDLDGSGPDGGGRRRMLAGLNRSAAADAGRTNGIDIAIFYTAAALSGAGGERGMSAWVELAIWEANDAYARSATGLQLRPVVVRAVNYVESGSIATDLSRFMSAGDGQLDEVHSIRDEAAADVSLLIVESDTSNRYAGMANGLRGLDTDSLSRGFTVCLRPYLVGNYTLAHEVAHLLGCAHDVANAETPGIEPWSYGTRINVDGRQYRTVMSYSPGVQFPHFSNPDVLFRGVPTGVRDGAGAADNARTLRTVAPLLARVRAPASRLGFATGILRVSENQGVARLEIVREGELGSPASCRITSRDATATNGVDYVFSGRTVEFAAGESRRELEVEVRDDERVDGTRRFTLSLGGPSSGSSLGPQATVDVLVEDDETESQTPVDAGYLTSFTADHAVSALARDAEGRMWVGGSFSSISGQVRPRLARLHRDGTLDAAFSPIVKYQVLAVAPLPGGKAAIAGVFNTVNGLRRNHVAILTPAGEVDAAFEFDTGTDYLVRALLAQPDGKLVAAGDFTTVQGIVALRTVRLLTNGVPDSTYGSRLGPDGDVLALQRDAAGRIYVGGRFGNIAARPRPGVGRLAADGAFDPGYGPASGPAGAVHALHLDDLGRLWIGGEFGTFAGSAWARLARLDAAGRLDAEFRPGTGADDAVLAMAPAGEGRVWVAGRFTRIQGRVRNRVARLLPDGTVDSAFDPGLGANDTVLALLPGERGGVVLGGLFTEVAGCPRRGLGAFLDGSPAPPRFRWWSLAGGGRFDWEASVEPGQPYSMEATDDLRRWTEVGVVRSSWGGRGDGSVRGAEGWKEGSGKLFRLRRRIE